jgi:hypothetical protein
MTIDCYTARPTRARIFSDAAYANIDGQIVEQREWFLDGVEEMDGRYTEACWSYDTFAEALADLPEFWRLYVAPNRIPSP